MVLFARQYVPTRADAEDVVQNAFVRFWRSRSVARDPLPYLYKCIRNGALEWRRSHGRRRAREDAASRDAANRESMFDRSAELVEQVEFIERALAELPPEQREVLVLKIWQGLTFSQIGAAIDIPANTAASRYRYGLAAMRRQLAEGLGP